MTNDKGLVGSASTTEGKTAAQILEQIKEKERELKANAAAQPVSPAPEPALPPAPVAPAPAPERPELNKPPQSAPESGAPVVPGPQGKDKPDWKQWIEKKGLLNTDGTVNMEKMVRNNRELERELWRKTGPGALTPPPATPEQPPIRPAYAPPPAPNVEELAKRYNLDPEDFQKVAPLAADIAASQVAARMAPLMAEFNGMKREMSRNSELQGLKEDPAFADPRVQFEMHQILESNPSILQNEPAPWRYAFNEALRTMGRRILEGSYDPGTQVPPVSGPSGLPTAPPKTAGGSGSGSSAPSGIQPPGRLSQEAFARLPAAEQRKVLAQMGLVNEQEV